MIKLIKKGSGGGNCILADVIPYFFFCWGGTIGNTVDQHNLHHSNMILNVLASNMEKFDSLLLFLDFLSNSLFDVNVMTETSHDLTS